MQKQLFLLLLLCFSHYLFAQSGSIIYYNKNGEEVKEKKAVWLLQKLKINDTCFEWNYYRKNGPRMKSEQYKNEAGTIQHGGFTSYDDSGRADSVGLYENGYREGEWLVFATNSRPIYHIKYDKGIPGDIKDSVQMNIEHAHYIDSLKGTIGKALAEKAFSRESIFPGGERGWVTHLQKNLSYPAEAIDKALQGTVVVQFIVNETGTVESPQIFHSANIYLDKEALRMLQISPDWISAMQRGKKVKSWKLQPITFQLSRK